MSRRTVRLAALFCAAADADARADDTRRHAHGVLAPGLLRLEIQERAAPNAGLRQVMAKLTATNKSIATLTTA